MVVSELPALLTVMIAVEEFLERLIFTGLTLKVPASAGEKLSVKTQIVKNKLATQPAWGNA
jgi:hypothetical protein